MIRPLPCAWLLALALAFLAPPLAAQPAPAADGCFARCHDDLHPAGSKQVHPDAKDKCETCHGKIAMKGGPHKDPGRTAKGLIQDPPGLCHRCHERKDFEGTNVHAPIESGPCSECHLPHASPHPGLLKKDATTLCLGCHDEVLKRPHFVAGFSKAGHPVGNEKPGKFVADPLNATRPYSCVSCHEPHRAKFARLLKMDKNLPGGFCWKCHPM